MKSVQHLAPSTPETSDCAYNLFRNKQRPEILCAVPEDRPIPRFVDPSSGHTRALLQPSGCPAIRLSRQSGICGCAV